MGFGAVDPSRLSRPSSPISSKPIYITQARLYHSRMPWFKKSKKSKSHRPFQQPTSLGIPAPIAAGPLGFGATLDLNVYPQGRRCSINIRHPVEADSAVATGENNGGGSQITLLSRASTDQQPHASGSSTKTPEPENAAASECVPSLLSKPMSMIPIAPQKPEHGHGAVVGDDKRGDDPTSECL